jgi:predicted O-methyltransferase YrrM
MATTVFDLRRALDIPGWMEPPELEWLAAQARNRHQIVEIGSFCGRSTRAMADHTPGTVTAIDSWEWDLRQVLTTPDSAAPLDCETQFRHNLSDLIAAKVVIPLRANHLHPPLLEAPPDMVFIDGDHTRDRFLADLLYWMERIAPGGLLCGHDAGNPAWPDVDEVLARVLPEAQRVPNTLLWYVEMPMPRALMEMSVAEVKLRGQAMAEDVKTVVVPAPPADWQRAGTKVTPTSLAVGICIPFGFRNPDGTLRWTPPEFSIALAMLQLPPNTNTMYFATKGVKRDEARNDLVYQALAAGARNILFLDDDNPPPPDALLKLLHVLDSADDDVALVAGIYVNKFEPSSPLVFQGEGAGPYWRWRVGDVFECASIATGCMMIRASVFAKIPEPWFHDITDLADAHAHGWFLDRQLGCPAEVTDDMYFSRKVREAGFKLLAHGGVLPGHWGQDGQCYRIAEDTYPFRGEVVSNGR